MQRHTLRSLALLALLALGVGAIWVWPRPRPAPPGAGATALQIVYVDWAGWYQTTADEKAVTSRYDLHWTALPAALPLQLGPWQGTDLGPDEAIETWFAQPERVLRRRYVDLEGHILWLTVIASRGPKSFHLFEHTPHTCYPSAGWSSLADEVQRVPLVSGSLAVRRGLFARGGERQVVYYWYQWDGPERDAAQGVASWRLVADAADDVTMAEARLQDFMRLLFAETLPWHRF